jgi:RHS repeat-associated protein
VTSYGYDEVGNRVTQTDANGHTTSYAYDQRLLNVLHQNGTNTLDGATYTYDAAGNRTAKTNLLNNITERYTYDPTYRLTEVTQGAMTTESYSYDAVGNRLSSLGMSPYVYNSSNELTSTPSATFTYDNNGNTLTKTDSSGTITYNWDFENRLSSVVLSASGGTVAFRYDPFGRRIQKVFTQGSSITTINYMNDGANAVEEVDATGNPLTHYAMGSDVDEPLSGLRSGSSAFYEQDGLGSVTSLSNSTAALGNSYTYDTFGSIVSSTGSVGNPFQYTGRDSDPETGLHYNRARYYDPMTARFLSEDPIGFSGGINFYRYAAESPVNLTDPSGLCTIDVYFVDPGSPLGKHSFIVMTDPTVSQRQALHGLAAVEVRAGPTERPWIWNVIGDAYTGDPEPGNYIHGGIEPFNQHALDYPDPDSASINILNDRCSCKKYRDAADKIVEKINDTKFEFNAFNQNSNSFTTTVLDGLGLHYPGSPPVLAPGWGNNLFRPWEYKPQY